MDKSEVFLTIEDLAENDDVSATLNGLLGLLRSVLQPIIDDIYPDIGKDGELSLNDISPEEGDVINFEYFASKSILLDQNKILYLSNFVDEFGDKREEILGRIKHDIMPTIKGELLDKFELSEQQFLIKVIRANINSHIAISPKKRSEAPSGRVGLGIVISIYLTIEDISILEPGEIGALFIKFRNLCNSTSRYSVEELRNWVVDMGVSVRDSERMNKDKLCEVIKDHYNF